MSKPEDSMTPNEIDAWRAKLNARAIDWREFDWPAINAALDAAGLTIVPKNDKGPK